MHRHPTAPRWLLIAGTLAIASGLTHSGPAAAAAPAGDAVNAYVEAYRSADPDAMVAVYTEGATFVDVSQRKEVTGKTALRQMLATLAISHAAMDVEVKRSVVEGKTAIVEVLYTGTIDTAAIGRSDLAPISYEIPAVLIFETAGKLIARQIDYLDYRTLSELMAKLTPLPTDAGNR